jgi:hypothetical protein
MRELIYGFAVLRLPKERNSAAQEIRGRRAALFLTLSDSARPRMSGSFPETVVTKIQTLSGP